MTVPTTTAWAIKAPDMKTYLIVEGTKEEAGVECRWKNQMLGTDRYRCVKVQITEMGGGK